ncbi:25493_t:CDS:2, partial [Gigaspora margarita]
MSITKTKKTDYIERIQSSKKFTSTIASQTKIDQDWAKIKAINSMIRQAIPESMFSEISKLRKVFEFTVIVIENENI